MHFKNWRVFLQQHLENTAHIFEMFCNALLFCSIRKTLYNFPKDLLLIAIYSFASQGANMAKQIGAATYIECSALQSENSVRDIFHVATLACVNKTNKNVKRNKSQRATKRISHMPSRPELSAVATDLRKDKAKSCTVMWISVSLMRTRKSSVKNTNNKTERWSLNEAHSQSHVFWRLRRCLERCSSFWNPVLRFGM